MKTLRQQHQNLDNKINTDYRNLIDELGVVSFYEDVEDEFYDFSDCETVSFINKNGENIDVKVLEICSDSGIYVADEENDEHRFFISLNDLTSLHDKITVVELLEIAQKQNEENDKLIERSIKASN